MVDAGRGERFFAPTEFGLRHVAVRCVRPSISLRTNGRGRHRQDEREGWAPSRRTGGVGTVTDERGGVGTVTTNGEGWAPSRRTGGVGTVTTNGRGRRRQGRTGGAGAVRTNESGSDGVLRPGAGHAARPEGRAMLAAGRRLDHAGYCCTVGLCGWRVDREPLRSWRAMRKLTTMTFCRFWGSRTVSMVSSRL